MLQGKLFIQKRNIIIYISIITTLLASCRHVDLAPDVAQAMEELPATIDFNIHVKPILSDRCFACHGPDQANRKAGLRLDLPESAMAELPENPDHYAIKSRSPASSMLVHRILSTDPEQIMPPPTSDLHLQAREKAILYRWIQEGAVYEPHWAFIPPRLMKPPTVNNKDWIQNDVDLFILDKLEQRGWATAQEADRETLLRRVSLDLTGLAPSLEDMDDFLADTSSDAYEMAVDKLFDSPAYGERMASIWMDLARFADTHGYTVDRYRDMSPWRDWVIHAFNDNMPYDQFVTWQLAGDLLPQPTRQQLLATGFNRHHQQNMEGGIVEEEFRVEYVADRTNTLGKAFLGLTLECARCHDHKYDPLSQKNYYELFSFFNNVPEAGQISWDNATPVPTMVLTDECTEELIEFIQQKIENQQATIAAIEDASGAIFDDWLVHKEYQQEIQTPPKGQIAHFPLDQLPIQNRVAPKEKGVLKQQDVITSIRPVLQSGYKGQALLLDGDAWLDLGELGAFDRHQAFSIGMWVNIPTELQDGVIFHKGDGAALYNWRGYHLALKNNRLEIIMAHTAPDNAIVMYANDIPRDQWIHLMLTYDGSSTAAGIHLYLDGRALNTDVHVDNLYKMILFGSGNPPQKGLQIGARWRGIGLKGGSVDEITIFECELTLLEVLAMADPDSLRSLANTDPHALQRSEREALEEYFKSNNISGHIAARSKLQALRQQQNEVIDTVPEIMVMKDMTTPRGTYILQRGQYDLYGESVSPATPEAVLGMPDTLPPDRLGLAQWLFMPDHPLTARVTVNRLWQQFFGRGLVATTEDFGNQGELPSHPELLDWLALKLIDGGWDIKAILKLIVTSATYRQSSKTEEAIRTADPDNVWMARGPSARLSAEMLRDNALMASGLLVHHIGGPSVKPYQPEGLWSIQGSKYQQDEGDKRYRRSLYTFWKRTIPHPTLATFDAPNRDNCTVRRQKTSTPLQALVLLNDPIYIEAARSIGQDISRSISFDEGVRQAFRKVTARHPTEAEVALLTELQQVEKKNFQNNPEKWKGWLETGDTPQDGQLDPALLAANTVVASTIINTDAAIVKR